MDRNAIVASVLIALIMGVWLIWFSPEPPAPVPESEISETVTPEEDSLAENGEQEAPEGATVSETATNVDSLYLDATTGTERSITVITDLFTAVLSTKGATLTSFQLSEYKKFDQVTPVQIVDTTQNGALSFLLTPRTGSLLSTKDVFFSLEGVDVEGEQDLSIDASDESQTLTFVASPGDGRLRISYTFTPGSYEVGLELTQAASPSFSRDDGYDLVWSGGIPFSEGDPEQEARVTAAYAMSGGELVKLGLDREPTEREIINGEVTWAAVKEAFFAAFLIPENTTEGAELQGVQQGEPGDSTFAETYGVRLSMSDMATEGDRFKLYIGPLEYRRISSYGLDLYEVVDYGFGQAISRPIARYVIIPSFNFLSRFIPNYGLIIIIFAVLVKIILFPLTRSSFKSMAKMRTLQPAMNELKEKYADNQQKQQQEMMKLYKDSGVNPVGSCLPQLLQLPILYALFRFFPSAIEIRQASFLWAGDLSAPDVILNLPFTIPMYGNYVAGFTLLMGISLFVQMQMQGGGMSAPGQSNAQTKIFQYAFPAMLFFFFNRFASGLSLYYLTYNVVTAVQQRFINKHIEDEKAENEPVRPERSKKPRSDQPKRVREARQQKESSDGDKKKGKRNR